MKKEKSTAKKMVTYSATKLPKITAKDREMLRSSKNKAIDFSDIPEITAKDMKKAVRMPPITNPAWKKKMKALAEENDDISLDNDVKTWFKTHSDNYHASINHVLRHYILSHELPR